jgi:hypothetical protein
MRYGSAANKKVATADGGFSRGWKTSGKPEKAHTPAVSVFVIIRIFFSVLLKKAFT